jgi:hypothetical protein
MQDWRDALAQHGFAVTHEEEIPKTMEFAPWAARHDATMQALLHAMLEETTPAVKEFLRPTQTDGHLTFDLKEALFVARRAARE